MKTHITTPVADDTTPTLRDRIADLRSRSKLLTPAIQKAADLYWALVDEQTEIDAEAAAIEQHIDDLESMVQYREESHRSRRRHKKFDRRAACQHRQNGLASLSDSTHVKLVIKARRKARRDRECDKSVEQIRRARLRKQNERGLNPAEILTLPEKRVAREQLQIELAEARRVAIIAACYDPDAVLANLNGECHDHYA